MPSCVSLGHQSMCHFKGVREHSMVGNTWVSDETTGVNEKCIMGRFTVCSLHQY